MFHCFLPGILVISTTAIDGNDLQSIETSCDAPLLCQSQLQTAQTINARPAHGERPDGNAARKKAEAMTTITLS